MEPPRYSNTESFAGLSLGDLLEARDAYHVHLVRQRHVVATAVGRYLIRASEAEDDHPMGLSERLALSPGERPARTLRNSVVLPWSWPCVLVFVDEWMDAAEIQRAPDEMVPRRLYLPDGRMVPTCVVHTPPVPDDALEPTPTPLSLPSDLFGGGYVCLTEVQGQQRVGTIACLVTDGLRTYALTNRHVAGRAGQPVTTLVGGMEVELGRAAGRSVGRLDFQRVYPGLPARRAEVAIDAGLIDITDVEHWTTQIFGVGQLGPLVDLSSETISLRLIGQPVRAFGGATGPMVGEVSALYYRYRTRGGMEYLADAIIGARVDQQPPQTRPGDSGTLWVLDDEPASGRDAVPTVTPLAVQWGGHRFGSPHGRSITPYALVTFLSTVCRALDVEPVESPSAEHDLYWGEVGHYTIGARACDLVTPPDLARFFVANRNRVSFDLTALAQGDYKTGTADVFHPLADVPDTVWKAHKRGWLRSKEGPNHFADMDDPLSPSDPRTLMSLFEADPGSVAPATWTNFYTDKHVAPNNMGLLPFRVAQLYTITVDALKKGDTVTALASAGVMAHYVGDACQPLHTSRWHDGRTPAEHGVHADYETAMVTTERAAIATGLDTALAHPEPLATITGHRAAAVATVELMQRTVRRLPPEQLIDAWDTVTHDTVRNNSDQLWHLVGPQTIDCIADGCRTLAMLWTSAWAEAGTTPPPAIPVSTDALRALYLNPDFAPSTYLPDHIAGW